MITETDCPIKCKNMNCKNRNYRQCDYFKNEITEKCLHKRQRTKKTTNTQCKYCPTTILKTKKPTDCIYEAYHE